MKTENRTADFYDIIRSRRSVRTYDSSAKMTEGELKEILEEAMLAPSGTNLNPWRFMVFTDPAEKAKLFPIAFGQQQVVDASAIIVVLGDMNAYTVENANRINQRAVDAGYMTDEVKDIINNGVENYYGSANEQTKKEWQMLDGGLLAMQFMLAAKARGYDTIPMLGYSIEQFRNEFNVPENLVNILMIAVGKASGPAYPTVRLGVDEVTTWNGVV
ncbi:nitroreductase family protein [Paenibacillus sp. GSMTC-2017]|uniref:nitroreductase family protein n=1 Tax=Paenibacillus sp. GSMTC-2017 TaxID=2794350 RepID=UPI0018D72F26|nr:nitroreductase family protein [Paenibacillus sp. GSMTC-2017]MBH5320293.1 nitroreductase family protein [Paenibacillus sp. GSMTC-2017]